MPDKSEPMLHTEIWYNLLCAIGSQIMNVSVCACKMDAAFFSTNIVCQDIRLKTSHRTDILIFAHHRNTAKRGTVYLYRGITFIYIRLTAFISTRT